jgi:dTDP-4-dehydrorhamnose 3,5-epimerase
MNMMKTNLPEVFLFEPTVFEDRRGWVHESFRADVLQSHGISAKFVQENFSCSKRGVLRGLHYQLKKPQAKICQVLSGAVLDVAVDIRYGSPTFGQHVMVELSADNHRQLYVPRGFAHGMLALEDDTRFIYKCDEYYRPDDSWGVAWNDPSLGIDWGIENPILSDTDIGLPHLRDLQVDMLPAYAG